MKSINTKSTESCNGPQSGSNCVIWQGTDIPSLGIKKGDSITTTLCTVLNKLVELATPLDLSTVNIQCLKDKLGVEEPAQRSLTTLLQIVIDSECTLKDLIDNAIAQINSANSNLVLDLKCLTQFDSHGNIISYNEQSVLQQLINQVCQSVDDITSINTQIATLKNQIQELNVPPYTEPLVTSCLFSSKPASQAVVILASDSCEYKTHVGQETDIQSALGQIPTAWTQQFGLTQNWVLSPDNMAKLTQNMLLVIQNQESRLLNIETSCCKVSCDSIIIDFDIKLSDDRETATLFFATKSTIPVGFHELDPLGSKLTITDSDGSIFTTRVKILDQMANADGFVVDLNASPLNPLLDYTFGMNPTLTNGALTCVKCVNKVAKYTETCSFCEITAVNIGSSNSTAFITYTEIGSTTIKSIMLHPGDTEVIKKHIKILSVATDGPISLTSPCNIDLNATETYQCINIRYAYTDSNTTGAWGIPANVTLNEIGYLDKKFTITGGNPVSDGALITNSIKTVLPTGVSLYTGYTQPDPTGHRGKMRIVMKVPSSIIPTLYLKFAVTDASPIKVLAENCDDSLGACCPDTSIPDTVLHPST